MVVGGWGCRQGVERINSFVPFRKYCLKQNMCIDIYSVDLYFIINALYLVGNPPHHHQLSPPPAFQIRPWPAGSSADIFQEGILFDNDSLPLRTPPCTYPLKIYNIKFVILLVKLGTKCRKRSMNNIIQIQ